MSKEKTIQIITIILLLSAFFTLASLLNSSLERYLLLSIALFSIGIYGLTTSRNAIRVLMSIEILLNAANINLVAFSTHVDSLQIKGQVFSLFVMAVAAAEAAIGLAIIIAIYRNAQSIDMKEMSQLKW